MHHIGLSQNDAALKENFDAIQFPNNSFKLEPKPRVASKGGLETADNLGPVSSRPVPHPRLGKVSAFVENTQSFYSLNEDSEENSECSDGDTMDTLSSVMSLTNVAPKTPKIDLTLYDSSRHCSMLPISEKVLLSERDVNTDEEMQRGLFTPVDLLQNAPSCTPVLEDTLSSSQATSEDDPPISRKTSWMEFLQSGQQIIINALYLLLSTFSKRPKEGMIQITGSQSNSPYRPPVAPVAPLTSLFKDCSPKLPPKPHPACKKPAVPMRAHIMPAAVPLNQAVPMKPAVLRPLETELIPIMGYQQAAVPLNQAVPIKFAVLPPWETELMPIMTSHLASAPLLLQTVTETERRICFMCEAKFATRQCDDCQNVSCDRCDELWHLYPLHRAHQRKHVVAKEEAAAAPEEKVVIIPPKQCNVFTGNLVPLSTGKDTVSGAIQKTSNGTEPKRTKSKRTKPYISQANQPKVQCKALTPQEKLQDQINEIVKNDVETLMQLDKIMERDQNCTNRNVQYMENILRQQHHDLYKEQLALEEQLLDETLVKCADVKKDNARPSGYIVREFQPRASASKNRVDYFQVGENTTREEYHFAEDAPGWECSYCTLINTNRETRICEICCKTYQDPEIKIGLPVKTAPKFTTAQEQTGYLRSLYRPHGPAQPKASESQVPTKAQVSDQHEEDEEWHSGPQLKLWSTFYQVPAKSEPLQKSLDQEKDWHSGPHLKLWLTSYQVPAKSKPLQKSVDHEKDHPKRSLMLNHDITSEQAETAIQLSTEYDINDCVNAVKQTDGSYEFATNFLNQKCQVCLTQFSMDKLVTMVLCQCHICSDCFQQHFTYLIKSDTNCVVKCTCPACDKPDISGGDKGEIETYFQYTVTMLQAYLEKDVYNLFQDKLRDWNLMKDKDFRWCAHCCFGFINERVNKKMRCENCNRHTCFYCKKQWMDQHKDLTCEQFSDWMEANDPDMQKKGLTAHLQQNGIDCPNCKFRYELAKGGCMHFKCTQCKFEFCCGCSAAFKIGGYCKKFNSCGTKGLHAHHPRDCLFHLRDYSIQELQQLLQANGQTYTANARVVDDHVCQVKEQRETPDGLIDARCGRATAQNTGLCKTHYIEYLVGLVNKHCIDPLQIFPAERIHAVLGRSEVQYRNINQGESPAAYRTFLTKVVQENLPLEKKPPKKRK